MLSTNEPPTLETRASACTNGTNEDTDTRLNFSTFCDLAFDGIDLPNGKVEVDNADDCMERCGIYTGASGCFGVSFSPPSTCLLKGKGITLDSKGTHSKPGSTLGLVSPVSQMEPSPSMKPECGYPNGTTVTDTKSGMRFEIFCDSDLDASAWASETVTTQNEHYDTLYECLSYCAFEGAPQCQAVVFDPTMTHGYQNCFPKTVSIHNASSALVPQSSPPHHVAVAKLPEVDGSCVEGQVIQSSEGKRYKLSCNQNIPDNDVEEAFHANSLEECTAECAKHVSATPGEDCVAITWDPFLRFHYANCYMKNSNGVPSREVKLISAQLTTEPVTGNKTDPDTSAPQTSSSGSGGGDDSGSNAWIAGVVVGSVALIAILGFLMWFYFRKQRFQSHAHTHMESLPIPQSTEYSTAPSSAISTHAHHLDPFQQSRYMIPVEADGLEVHEGGFKEPMEPVELDVPKRPY